VAGARARTDQRHRGTHLMNPLSRKRLIDKLVAAYVDWREACARVNDAYRFRASEPGPSDRVAFGLYVAALNVEQQAAEVYGRAIRDAGKLVRSDEPAAQPLLGPGLGAGWR
jgi:hypothetical protein